MEITILTPTYNRGYTIGKLYDSLVRQTNKNFEWIVIDDGSIDNTREIIKKYIEEKKIRIKYIYQQNGGKHRALNKGISLIKNEMTLIVDSDDYLLDDAIEKINSYYNRYKNNTELCGYSFLKCYANKQNVGKKYKKDEYISDYISCRINENVYGDKSEVFFTKYLQEFPFLEVENERFLFEDYVWIQIAEKYKTLYINETICVVEYLEDGLTKNGNTHKINSPIGMSERGLILCTKKCKRTIIRLKGMMMYISYGLLSKKTVKQLYDRCKYRLLFIISFLPALVFNKVLNRRKKNESKKN